MSIPRPSGLAMILAALLLPGTAAQAIETTFSGFGTLGWAQSDHDYRYLAAIDKQGTLHRDSRLGIQMDMRLTPQWSVTAQLTADAADDHDSAFKPRLKWAFLSYRPNNDWLLRAGKLRVGSFLNMQNMDQGVTYDWARMPAETYSVSPSYDFTGVSINRGWTFDDGLEVNLEGIWGRTRNTWRQYLTGSGKAVFIPLNLTVKGAVLTVNQEESLYRLGWYHAKPRIRGEGQFASQFDVVPNVVPNPPNPLAGMGGDLLVPTWVNETSAQVFTLGAQVPVGPYTLTGEFARRMVNDMKTGPNSYGGYLAVSRRIGQWTPYLMHARLQSGSKERAQRRQVQQAVPPSTGGAMPAVDAQVAGSYADAASGVYIFDQYSWMLGTAYNISPTQKLKVELMRTRIGEGSSLVDGNVSKSTNHVLSISYNFVF